MKSVKIFTVLFSIIFVLLLFNSSMAKETINIKIEYIAPEDGISPNNKLILEKLTDKLLSKGYKIDKNAEWKIFINIFHMDKPNSGKIILVYTLSQTLPKPIIDFGTKNEVYYLVIGNKERKEGQNKQIREYMTSEFLHQFSTIIDSKMYASEQSKIGSKLDEVVEDIDKGINLLICSNNSN